MDQAATPFGAEPVTAIDAAPVSLHAGLLVKLLPNRGARLRTLGEHDVSELLDVVGGLEALAGRLACERITHGEIAEIERLHHEMHAFYLRRDMHGYFAFNQAIHQRIVEACRNETLRMTYATFATRVRYGAILARNRQRRGEAMQEHEAILDTLRRRAADELSDILFRHLRNRSGAALEQMAARDEGVV
ncbi:GntR family transcriptional regulator [Lichenicoccus roseus]|uniref:GntR family transcriptional regulator n=1 Tax=Lichenicoccus roseus TaxID=2683649 RepID=A0A5R9JAD3_9PROT|nr:GntR family transcriptional regulator [Lichenicoccus roseus]TLU74560.1 GntR family transcriptional regulator [Lichenicoccus roseus]